jgi:hypothetical protein
MVANLDTGANENRNNFLADENIVNASNMIVFVSILKIVCDSQTLLRVGAYKFHRLIIPEKDVKLLMLNFINVLVLFVEAVIH